MSSAVKDIPPIYYRWHAVVTYRTDSCSLTVEYDLKELKEIDSRIEAGPHFDTVEEIVITRAGHVTSETLTIEQAEKL